MSIKLHGKEYVEVKDRVQAAHAEESYSMLREETFSMGGREYVRVYIDVKGKQYIGTAECKFGANPKTPDGMSPFECGETSALGRALGFAGYGVVESIASADEVVRNQEPESSDKLTQVKAHFGKLYKPDRWEPFKVMVLGLPVADEGLSDSELAKLNGKLIEIEKQKPAKMA